VVWYPASQKDQWDGIRDRFVSGASASRARRARPKRLLSWTCEVSGEIDKDKIGGFLSDLHCSGGLSFYFPWPVNNVWPPSFAPTLGQVAGGAYGARTLFAKFTWADASTGETTASDEASLAVDAGKVLTVAVRSWPAGVDHVNFYLGTSTGVLYYSGRILTTDTTWTEDATATTVDADSASGQKVLKLASTVGFQVGCVVQIGISEACIIASIQAGTSLTMKQNLTATHLAITGESVTTTVGLATQAVPPAANTLSETLRVAFVSEPEIPARSVGIWSIAFDLEEVFP
jgi:hypothetical protein